MKYIKNIIGDAAEFSESNTSSTFKKKFLCHFVRLRPYLLIIFAFVLFVPWYPLVSTLDYEYGMHLFVSKGWQYGTDIISTYGPLGFICLSFYENSTYLIMIIANIGLYLFMVFYLWRFWRSMIGTDHSPAVWIAALLILPAFKQPDQWAPALFMPFILINLLVLWHFLNEKPPSSFLLTPLVIILTAFVFVKGTFIFLISIGIALVSLDQMFKWRRVPWLILVFIATVFALWVLSGQKVAHLSSYFLNTVEVITGYKDGMSLSGRNDWASVPIFVLASISITGLFWWVLQQRIGWRSVYPAGVLAATLFVAFQHGFVRAGFTHIVPAYLTFFMMCILIFPLLWKFSTEKGSHRFLRNFIVGIAVISLCGMFLSGDPKWKVLYQRPYDFWKLISQGKVSLQAAAAANLQRIKQEYPLPKLKEPVDSYAIDFGLAEAYGLHSTILPSLSSWGAYTPHLSWQNREYIENATGPATILLRTHGSIDGRYPTVTDSLSVLGLKSHFKAITITGKLLILERREHPLRVQLVKLEEQEAGFNDIVLVPAQVADIFVQIDIKPTWGGQIFNVLYKPPPVYIAINDGTQKETFRLTTSLAREGMLLSPLLDNLSALQCFYSLSCPKAPLKISAFRLQCQSGREWYYHDRIKVTFFKLIMK